MKRFSRIEFVSQVSIAGAERGLRRPYGQEEEKADQSNSVQEVATTVPTASATTDWRLSLVKADLQAAGMGNSMDR